MKTNDVFGIGNALMDFLIETDEQHLAELGLRKGEMHLVEEEKAKEILALLEKKKVPMEIAPGGSVANTSRGISLLGGKVIFCGKVGEDKQGFAYVEEMQKQGISTRIKHHQEKITGRCFSFITRDAQRTFSTHLGAAIHLAPEEILEEDIASSKILHLEGYQLEGDTKETVLQALETARKHGTLISLDLADPGVIRRNKKILQKIVQDYVNILFVNEQEAEEFTGFKEEEALRELGKQVTTAIVKIGKRGSWIIHEGRTLRIEPVPAQAIDTTGAGDTYAAGFLYGLTQSWPVERCGKLGSLMAARMVEQKGVKIDKLDLERMKEIVQGNEKIL